MLNKQFLANRIKTIENASATIAFLALGTVLTCVFTLFFFAHPNADDFCTAGKVYSFGVIDGVMDEYFNWTGRWTQYTVLYGVSSVLDLVKYYSWLLILCALIYAFSLFTFFRSFFGKQLDLKSAIMMAVSVFCLYWAGIVTPGQTFYWWSGATNYSLSLTGMLFLFAGLLRVRNENILVTLIQTVLLCVLALVTTGVNDLLGLILCIVLGVSVVIMFKSRHPNRIVWFIVLLAALAGFLVVYTAPGNEFRKLDTAQIVKYGDFKLSLALTLKQIVYYGARWVLDVKLLSVSIFFIMSPGFRAIGLPRVFQQYSRWKLIVPITWIVVLVLAIFGFSWGLGKTMASRQVNIVYMLFLIGWIVNVFVFMRWPLNVNSDDEIIARSVRAFALGLFALSLIGTGSTPQAFFDLMGGQVAQYDQNMQRRYKQIHSEIEQGNLDVRVPAVKDRPKIFFEKFSWADIDKNPKSWTNLCAAKYFRLESIAIERSHMKKSNNLPGD